MSKPALVFSLLLIVGLTSWNASANSPTRKPFVERVYIGPKQGVHGQAVVWQSYILRENSGRAWPDDFEPVSFEFSDGSAVGYKWIERPKGFYNSLTGPILEIYHKDSGLRVGTVDFFPYLTAIPQQMQIRSLVGVLREGGKIILNAEEALRAVGARSEDYILFDETLWFVRDTGHSILTPARRVRTSADSESEMVFLPVSQSPFDPVGIHLVDYWLEVEDGTAYLRRHVRLPLADTVEEYFKAKEQERPFLKRKIGDLAPVVRVRGLEAYQVLGSGRVWLSNQFNGVIVDLESCNESLGGGPPPESGS